jgi:hypothetical protein
MFICLCIACIILSLSLLVFRISPVESLKTKEPNQLLPQFRYGDELSMQTGRDLLQQFVKQNLSGINGVYTNYLDTDQNNLLPTGHEVLSESAGLLLRYYARTGQHQAFDAEWQKAKERLSLDNGFSYRYSPKLDKTYPVNAAIDDLRILRALYEGAEAFTDEQYREEALLYGSRFTSHNIINGQLFDFYDGTYQTVNDSITLCYLDLQSLSLLPLPQKERDHLLSQSLEIIQKGYLSDTFPFYETRYHYQTKSYQTGTIQTVESLLTILALSEVEAQAPESIRFLSQQVAQGTLYGAYNRDGTPANSVKSTAIYAITAMIGATLNDKNLYASSIHQMNAFRVEQADNPLVGAFGDANTLIAYSFDNLMALLAYTY